MMLKFGVRPIVKPAVPKAETVSYKIAVKDAPASVNYNIKLTTTTRPEPIKNKVNAL